MWGGLWGIFDKKQIQPSIDFANEIEIRVCNRAINIDCGSGMSTLAL